MAQYTTSIRNLCQVLSNKEDYTESINAVVLEAAPKIFDFTFPFYDESKKIDWEVRFLKHFYMREISAETVSLFKLWLEDTLNQIMPKYNKMYLAAESEYKLFQTYAEHEELTREGSGSSSGSASAEGVATHSTTPQGTLSNFLDNKYLDDANQTTSSNSSEASAESSETVERDTYGYTGRTPAEMLMEFNRLFGSVDQLIYQECESLFFGLWQ